VASDALAPTAPSGSRRQLIIGALGVTQILAWGSSYYLLAVLAAPVAKDTGWPLPWIVGALSAGLLVAGIVSPLVGRTVGRLGGRPVLVGSAVLLALGLAIIGAAPSLPAFVFGWLVIGAGMGAGLYDAAFATLGRIYGEAARPAISTLTLWGGFASTACWPLSAYLVEHLGWRGACFAYAGIQIGISLPILLTLVPRAPPVTLQPTDTSAADGALGRTERVAFGLLAAVLTLGGATTAIISVHLLTLLQERGMPLAAAVSLGALIGPSQVAARVLEMAGRGRHHPIWTLVVAMSLIAVGVVLLCAGFPVVAVALVCYGAGNGIYSIARGTLPLAVFGPHRYAELMGRLAMPSLLAQALAPSLGAFVVGRFGAQASLGLLAIGAAANVGLTAALWTIVRRRTTNGSAAAASELNAARPRTGRGRLGRG
jgi:MFS family permease